MREAFITGIGVGIALMALLITFKAELVPLLFGAAFGVIVLLAVIVYQRLDSDLEQRIQASYRFKR